MPIKILTKLQMTQHCQLISTGFGNLLPWRNPSIGWGNVWRRWHSGDVHHTHNALICVVCKVQTRLSDSMQQMRSNEMRHIFSGITRIVCQKSCVLQCTSFTFTVKDRNLMTCRKKSAKQYLIPSLSGLLEFCGTRQTEEFHPYFALTTFYLQLYFHFAHLVQGSWIRTGKGNGYQAFLWQLLYKTIGDGGPWRTKTSCLIINSFYQNPIPVGKLN